MTWIRIWVHIICGIIFFNFSFVRPDHLLKQRIICSRQGVYQREKYALKAVSDYMAIYTLALSGASDKITIKLQGVIKFTEINIIYNNNIN